MQNCNKQIYNSILLCIKIDDLCASTFTCILLCGSVMSTSSVCNVLNIINEQFRGYIEPEDLYILLKHLFPNVARKEDFQLDVRL